MPDYQNEDGLRISAVLSGGAAEAAGLQAGDVIQTIGGKPVANIEVYMERLAELHPGTQTIVRFRRGNDVKEVTVKFPATSPPPDGSGAPGASSAGAATGAHP
jgi:S1-C subfamily serine protease